MAKDVLLDDLNNEQRLAIQHCDGPLLVLAGAGSGKTRVITRKFAYLAKKKKLPPASIFTVTFTNKAANEMKQRIGQHITADNKGFWVGTFHSQCNRILRREIAALGYKPDFTVYDDDDQSSLIRHILREFNIYEALFKGVVSRISMLKAQLITPEDFLARGDGFSFDEKLGRAYLKYQHELKRANALDFDDLIMLTVKLLEENPKILKKYTSLFEYLLVDEFQDTNRAQYRLMQLLSSGHNNISVVGDDDQSIYYFRGADVSNILNFEKDYPKAKVIKLEQNYRSTQSILDASGSVIAQNKDRKAKQLWTERRSDEKVCYSLVQNEDEEAKQVARSIKDLYLKGKCEYRDVAVLYRTNIQARAIEDALRAEHIPYHVISGISFYQRKEIKDILSYMRLVTNSDDNVSLRRIINSPPRGIGVSTITKVEQEAKKQGASMFRTMKLMLKSQSLAASFKDKVGEFVHLIEKLAHTPHKTAADMLKDIVERSGYLNELEDERIQNVLELVSSAEGIPVREFLDRAALSSATDHLQESKGVSLLTLHSAKGLEFPTVFIVGLEEGILPYFKAMDSPREIQEERRLFYVGMTRAKDRLFLSSARRRRLYSKIQDQEPSRFLKDIRPEDCERVERTCSQPVAVAAPAKALPKAPKSLYIVGCRVKHPSWGIGVVRDCSGEGEDTKITVNFQSVGLKRLAVKMANLEKV